MKKPKTTDRIKVTVEQNGAYNFSHYEFTLESLKSAFDHFRQLHPSFAENEVYMAIDYSRGYYDDIDIDIKIIGSRMENDEEYAARQEKENAEDVKRKANEAKVRREAKAKRDAKDLVEYERLRKKFEKGNK